MNNDTLIILTNRYPFPPKEEFLETELFYLSREFSKVYLIPVNYNKKEGIGSRSIPNNTEILLSPSFKRSDLPRYMLNPLALKWISKDILRALKISPKALPVLSYWVSRAIVINDFLKKEVIPKVDLSRTVFYSYWTTPSAISLVMLKEEYKELKAVSRVHGGDLYEERHSPKFIPLQMQTLENLNQVFTISDDGQEYLLKRNNNLKSKLSLNRLGTKQVNNQLNRRSADQIFRIVTCSYIVPVKRIPLLIKALMLCNSQIEWTHIGDGPSRNEIEQLASELPDNVSYQILGNLQNQDVFEYYLTNPVDLFVNVSESEGIPVTIMEAFSCGVPALATNVGGVSEIVNTENGILIKKDIPPHELAKRIEQFISLPEELQLTYRSNALNTWKAKYSAEKNYPDFAKILHQI